MVGFQWRLIRCKCLKVSRTSLGILTDLNKTSQNIFILSLTSSTVFNPLYDVQAYQQQLISPRSSCFRIFFHFSGKVQIFVDLFTFFDSALWSARQQFLLVVLLVEVVVRVEEKLLENICIKIITRNSWNHCMQNICAQVQHDVTHKSLICR